MTDKDQDPRPLDRETLDALIQNDSMPACMRRGDDGSILPEVGVYLLALRDAILATSPPIQGEPCPTNHKAPNGESWSEIEWLICVGGEDYEKWTSATSNRVYDHCPDRGQPLSSPVKEET